jgi:hypothetical protein
MTLRVDLRKQFDTAVAHELGRRPVRPHGVLDETSLAPLPEPVRRYVCATGALGRPVPHSMRVEFDAAMRRAPGARPMRSTSVQYNLFDRPTRLFLMDARMFGLPVRALHLYREQAATFRVRVASLVDMVDLRGPEISRAETVTVLNDLCVMAPGALVDPRLAWDPIDDRSARVTFTNGPHIVTATLVLDADGLLVDFWSDDRPDSSTGTFVPMRWRTPLGDYRVMADGVRVATTGSALYERPDGPFAYGEFTLRSLEYDVQLAGARTPQVNDAR